MRLLLLILLLLAGAGLYLYLQPESATRVMDSLGIPDISHKTDRVYKWRNERGEWQLTDTPPPEGIGYERTDYRDDLNVLPVPPGIGSE